MKGEHVTCPQASSGGKGSEGTEEGKAGSTLS